MEGIKIVEAACLCGNFDVRIALRKTSLPLPATFCHCETCRRSSGALANSYVNLEPGSWAPEATVVERLKAYKSSPSVSRYFCPTCGCHVLWHGPGKDDWHVPSGVLRKLDGVAQFRRHIWTRDTLDGGFSDWFPSQNGQSLTIPDASSAQQPQPSDSSSPDPDKRLYAHCSCGGINMYISRPSPSSEKVTSSSSTPPPPPDVLVPHNSGPSNLCANETWWLRADKRKFLGGICACDSCRLVNGFEFIYWAFVPTSDISLDPAGHTPFSRDFGTLKAFRSSDAATRFFCADCGATVFWDGDVRPGLIDVAAGLLNAPEGARAESWLEWRTERVSAREDAEKRAKGLIEGVESGLRAWGEKVQDRKGPHAEFLRVHDGNINEL
ncbi:hypothetical protein AAFC00_001487 [Neodothiora populina]|uniref:CENP-V/GFA domain-containing protein n=1 Tax=Neodothiora populina TaxID=2781224 RepID=A0ABR3PP42_9PEZI